MQETWKDIKNYEGLYQISTLGRIKSFPRKGTYKNAKILKPYKDGGNYYYVIGLHKNGKRKYKAIHRLVAETFIPNPNNYPLVNHKDENKLNNCVDNLEWCTHKYNSNYGKANLIMSKKAIENWKIRRLKNKN
jgi:hypothetical protein